MNATNVAASRHPHAKSELRNTGKNERWLSPYPQRQSARTQSCGKQKEGLDSTHLITNPGSFFRRGTLLSDMGREIPGATTHKRGCQNEEDTPTSVCIKKVKWIYKIPLADAQLNVQILAVLSVTCFILFHISLRRLDLLKLTILKFQTYLLRCAVLILPLSCFLGLCWHLHLETSLFSSWQFVLILSPLCLSVLDSRIPLAKVIQLMWLYPYIYSSFQVFIFLFVRFWGRRILHFPIIFSYFFLK